MPLLKAGPFSMFIGKSPTGWFSTRLEFAENHDTNAQLDNGIELSVKLDSVTARIGADSTTEYVIDPVTDEKIWAKETRLFGETLGHVSAERVRALKDHKAEIERFKENRKKPAIDVTAEPA